MSSRTYHFFIPKSLYGNIRYIKTESLMIKCIGGENMEKKEDKLVFLDSPKFIPKTKGAVGRDWTELFNKIPEGKVLVLDSETYGSSPNIRKQVKDYNKDNNNALKVTQRTVEEKIIVYITRKASE